MKKSGGGALTSLSRLTDLLNRRGSQILYEGDSEHHHIIVKDEDGCRTLYLGPAGQEAETSINLANPEATVFEYPGLMLAALPLCPQGREIAMIGLGGGYLPGLFRRHLPNYSLTVAEIDALVVQLAETYFGFQADEKIRLVVGDGRDFIASRPEASLDQIWLDAFTGDYIPRHLTSFEFYQLCLARLRPGGLLVQNLHRSRPSLFQDQLKTTQALFEDCLCLAGVNCGNVIVITRAPGGEETAWPWRPQALIRAAKDFGPRIGPYNLVRELSKISKLTPLCEAQVIHDRL